MSVASPSRAAFPGSQAGRHPRLHFRGLLRLHSNYGPLDRSTAQGGLCHRASIHPVTRINRLPATRSNRQLSGWFLPPLVIRAFWAHYDPEVVCDGVAPFFHSCGIRRRKKSKTASTKWLKLAGNLLWVTSRCMTAHNLSMALRWGAWAGRKTSVMRQSGLSSHCRTTRA